MNARTDFDAELEKIDQALAQIEGHAFKLPIDSERATKYVYLFYQRASLMGDLAGFVDVEKALQRAIDELIGLVGVARIAADDVREFGIEESHGVNITKSPSAS